MCGEAGGIAKGTVGSRAKACTATALAVAGEQVEALRLRPRSGADSGASGVGGRSHSGGLLALAGRRSSSAKWRGLLPASSLPSILIRSQYRCFGSVGFGDYPKGLPCGFKLVG